MNNILSLKHIVPVLISLFIFSSAYGADHNDQHSGSHSGEMTTENSGQHDDSHAETMTAEQQKDMFLEKKEIDSYTVSFHVMRVNPGMEHGGTHNLMVKIEQGSTVLGDALINSKVIRPDGTSDTKRLMKMGDWYMSGYDLGGQGKYQLIILFKTSDGKKHKGGVYYQENSDK